MTPKPKPNQVPVPADDAMIIVQSCDSKLAHICIGVGVRRPVGKRRSANFHVSLPDLVREWRIRYPGELSAKEYDRILRENKDTLLRVIDQLNEVK
jgi:hypothetical protein